MRCLRWRIVAVSCLLLAIVACRQDADRASQDGDGGAQAAGSVTISGDDRLAESLSWRAPEVALAESDIPQARKRAAEAVTEGRLFEDAEAAIPLYLAILQRLPGDAEAGRGLQRALAAAIAQGDASLAQADDDIEALRRAHLVAAVARATDGDADAVHDYLQRVDVADRAWALNVEAEKRLRAGEYGVQGGGGALPGFRSVLQLRPGQARALQGIAAIESGLIRRAEIAGSEGDFDVARHWLALAATLRPDSPTNTDAAARIETLRLVRIARLRDEGLELLPRYNGVSLARRKLANLLLIAEPGDPAAAELRSRIDLAAHYGMFRPGQAFTDAMPSGGRGPQMIVVPHGAFTMGAPEGEVDASDSERPVRNIRFDRGFAMSVHEVTVGEFGRYVAATSARTRAARRGYSMPYDERSNNFVRRSAVDWRSDYLGAPASDDMPVLHVSARDADGYVAWLSAQTGRHYRLPSEAEFEYALRAGSRTRYPWGEGAPPAGSANVTGARDRSPGGRTWSNAFAGYGDGFWGPAPVGRLRANAYGLHELAGNVSEWVADCWHDTYRRAPEDGAAWVNPGCRMRVVRGGSWSSSPAQVRSAWRAPVEVDNTNARIGFRVVRDL